MITSNILTDVGAGGLSNALPELLHDTKLGSRFELRDIDNVDRGMRYVAPSPKLLSNLKAILGCETFSGDI